MKPIRTWICLSLLAVCSAFVLKNVYDKPVFYIIGDSTVRNGDGKGRNGQWGWGDFMQEFMDTSKISIRNHALGGRSSRTFITEGRWAKILETLKSGDIVIMQFGHNDAGPLDDTARARGTIRGIGDESKEIYNPIRKVQETVYTYGWYLRKYIRETKAAGAIPIVCSPVPRDNWKGNRVRRADADYGLWAKQVAEAEGACFIDLNGAIADEYDRLGKDTVAGYFKGDHTHTNETGARLNASIVAKLLAEGKNECSFKQYLNHQ